MIRICTEAIQNELISDETGNRLNLLESYSEESPLNGCTDSSIVNEAKDKQKQRYKVDLETTKQEYQDRDID